jgi:hypothetical protein
MGLMFRLGRRKFHLLTERATRPVATRRRRAGAIARSERRDDRPNARGREGCGGGRRRRRAGFYSAIRREVPIRTFNDWKDPAPGFCEVDMVAHGGTSTTGSFIQTLTMVEVATGWTECLPLVNRDGSLVVEAIKRSQSLFPWLLRGVDFDNDSAFMNEVVIPWCRGQKLEVTRSRAYKKNDQAFVEQKNGAVVAARQVLLEHHAGFDGLAEPDLVGEQHPASELLEHLAHGLDLIPEGLDAVEVRQAEQLVEALRETEARKALAQIVPAAILVRRLLHGGDDWREMELDGERHIDVDQRQLARRGEWL